MGLRFRRSISLGGGVRLNFSKSGIGISGGARGARVGIGPGGLRTAVGIPGTGIYYEKRGTSNMPAPRKKQRDHLPQKVNIGFFQSLALSPAERSFIEGINFFLEQEYEKARQCFRGTRQMEPKIVDAAFMLMLLGDKEEQKSALESALSGLEEYGRTFQKFNLLVGGNLPITDDLALTVVNDLRGFFLLAAEIMEDNHEIDRAIDLLENCGLSEDPLIKLSLGELYLQSGRWQDCVQLLQGIENNDAVAANSLLLVGMALEQMGFRGPAIEVFRKARRRKKNRPPALLREISYQLALALEKEGRKAQAKKEYETIVAEDAGFKEAKDRLLALK